MPQYALAFNQHVQAESLSFPTDTIIFDEPMTASYLFEEGSIVGAAFSAYSSTVAETDADPFTTAWGTKTRPGVAAANFLPLGTKITAFGQTYVIEDRMNARYNNEYHVDIWMASQADALSFGRRQGVVEVISLP